ncbi:MAG: dihydroxy-acid dehydratase, partial [Micropepsaceae bacterium]
AGSGTIIWQGRQMLAKGEIGYGEFMEMAAASAPSAGHCNTMGTALSMNSVAEALGMSLTGCASIPAPYRERAQMAHATGVRIVEMVSEDLKPSDVMTKVAFVNAIRVAAAIGASTNCPPHLIAIARHMGVELTLDDWQRFGYEVPLLVNCMPAGAHLGEGFHRAGGVPAVVAELIEAGLIEPAKTVTGRTIVENCRGRVTSDRDVVRAVVAPLKANAGFLVMSGNLFDAAVMKTSVIGEEFAARYLSNGGAFEGRAIVFDGPEDYHARINDTALAIDEQCILVMRNCGPIGYPGSAEVVNMQPPDALIKRGITALPCIGDGRQSGTSASPSILNASPEAAVGGGLALLKTGDVVRIDLNERRVDALVPADEWERRRKAWTPPKLVSQTPWEEIARANTGQLSTGACFEPATLYIDIINTRGEARDSH